MKRKVKILFGGIILFSALTINFIFSNKFQSTEITFDNIEAIAQQESGGDFTPTCIYVGNICTGIDKDGNMGTFSGLSALKP